MKWLTMLFLLVVFCVPVFAQPVEEEEFCSPWIEIYAFNVLNRNVHLALDWGGTCEGNYHILFTIRVVTTPGLPGHIIESGSWPGGKQQICYFTVPWEYVPFIEVKAHAVIVCDDCGSADQCSATYYQGLWAWVLPPFSPIRLLWLAVDPDEAMPLY